MGGQVGGFGFASGDGGVDVVFPADSAPRAVGGLLCGGCHSLHLLQLRSDGRAQHLLESGRQKCEHVDALGSLHYCHQSRTVCWPCHLWILLYSQGRRR